MGSSWPPPSFINEKRELSATQSDIFVVGEKNEKPVSVEEFVNVRDPDSGHPIRLILKIERSSMRAMARLGEVRGREGGREGTGEGGGGGGNFELRVIIKVRRAFFRETGPTRNSGHEPRDAEYVTISTVHSRWRNNGAGSIPPPPLYFLSLLPSVLCNHRGKINNPGTRGARRR